MLNKFNVIGIVKVILHKSIYHNAVEMHQIVVSTTTPKGTYSEIVLTIFKKMYLSIKSNLDVYGEQLAVFEGFIDQNKLIVTKCYSVRSELMENTLNDNNQGGVAND